MRHPVAPQSRYIDDPNKSRRWTAAVVVCAVGGAAWVGFSQSGSADLTLELPTGPNDTGLATQELVPDPAVEAACGRWDRDPASKVSLEQAIAGVAQQHIVTNGLAPGGVVAVGCGDRLLASVAVGTLEGATPVSAETTQYDIASVNKMFTATAVIMLAQQGKLSLDQVVGDFLPEYASGTKAGITFRHLLQHRAGLDDPSRHADLIKGAQSPDAVRTNVLALQPTLPVGQQHLYSNAGYIAAADAASRAAGEPLHEFMKREIFEPLGMEHTGFAPDLKQCAPTSPSNDRSAVLNCVPQDQLARELAVPTGHASMFSTAEDLAKFAGMMASGGKAGGRVFITPENLAMMQAAQPDAAYGTGVRLNHDNKYSDLMGLDMYGHTGYTSAGVFIDADARLTVSYISNATLHKKPSGAARQAAIKAVSDTLVNAHNSLAP